MVIFTKKWISAEIKSFDFEFYLMHFLNKCVRKDTISIIGNYIKLLDLPSLLKINEIIFKLSFEEDKKRLILPESNDWNVQLASLTAAGFADKYILVSKIMPLFSEQLVWK